MIMHLHDIFLPFLCRIVCRKMASAQKNSLSTRLLHFVKIATKNSPQKRNKRSIWKAKSISKWSVWLVAPYVFTFYPCYKWHIYCNDSFKKGKLVSDRQSTATSQDATLSETFSSSSPTRYSKRSRATKVTTKSSFILFRQIKQAL